MPQGDMRFRVNVDMREKKETPDISIQGEGTSATSISTPTSNSKLVGSSSLPPCPSTIASAIGMIIIPCEFLHSLVDNHRATNSWLWAIETKVTTL